LILELRVAERRLADPLLPQSSLPLQPRPLRLGSDELQVPIGTAQSTPRALQ
jgi:hypothetical protein